MIEKSRWQKIENLFNTASHLPAGKRNIFVNDSCGIDIDLREEVTSLLVRVEAGDSFFDFSPLTLGFGLLTGSAVADGGSLQGKPRGIITW